MTHPIYPCLWFDGQAQEAVDFYCSVFRDSHKVSEDPMILVFELNGARFMALNSRTSYRFSPAHSLVVTCDSQEEIDYYWEILGTGGVYNRCGWLDDRFGVSWQIVPSVLSDLMRDPVTAPKVVEAFLRMTKFEIAPLLEAAGKGG
ncbi:VOC family protein [bacterium]|nr:VOC family protein [bacterium]